MIPIGGYLEVFDSSGAQQVQVIGLLKKFRKRFGVIRDTFIVVIKSVKRTHESVKRKVKEGMIVYSILVRTNRNEKRFGGTYIKGDENGMVLLNKENELIARRVSTYVLFNIRDRIGLKLATMVYNLI